MTRPVNLVMIGLVVVLSIALYNIKYRAEEQEAAVRALHHEIGDERESLRVLRAEWGYLTQPDRIQTLAERHLDLEPLQASQIVTFEDMPPPRQPNDLYGPYGRQSLGGFAGTLPERAVQ